MSRIFRRPHIMSFTVKLDLLMKEQNLTKAELSRAANIPYTTIDGFYKKGTDNVKLSTLKRLCAYFNCSLDYLVMDNVEEQRVLLDEVLSHGEFTEEEIKEICDFASYLKSKREKKKCAK